jgi:hypothetical protein
VARGLMPTAWSYNTRKWLKSSFWEDWGQNLQKVTKDSRSIERGEKWWGRKDYWNGEAVKSWSQEPRLWWDTRRIQESYQGINSQRSQYPVLESFGHCVRALIP